MGIIWDELTVLFMCLVAKQKYRLETGCSELHNTVFLQTVDWTYTISTDEPEHC